MFKSLVYSTKKKNIRKLFKISYNYYSKYNNYNGIWLMYFVTNLIRFAHNVVNVVARSNICLLIRILSSFYLQIFFAFVKRNTFVYKKFYYILKSSENQNNLHQQYNLGMLINYIFVLLDFDFFINDKNYNYNLIINPFKRAENLFFNILETLKIYFFYFVFTHDSMVENSNFYKKNTNKFVKLANILSLFFAEKKKITEVGIMGGAVVKKSDESADESKIIKWFKLLIWSFLKRNLDFVIKVVSYVPVIFVTSYLCFKSQKSQKILKNYKNSINSIFIVLSLLLSLTVFVEIVKEFESSRPLIISLLIRKLIFVVCLLSSFYICLSFLKNSVSYGKYVSINRRFWKTAFTSFWLIEFFLFFIFTYLTLIAPNESVITLDEQKLAIRDYPSFQSFNFVMFVIVSSSLLVRLLQNSNFKKRFKNLSIRSLLLSLVVHFFIFIEFDKFYTMLRLFKYRKKFMEHTGLHSMNLRYQDLKDNFKIVKINLSASTTYKNMSTRHSRIVLAPNVFKFRTENYFFMLLIFLKFWHIAAVFFMYVYFSLMYLSNKKVTTDFSSAMSLAFIYMVLFHFYYFIQFFKIHFYGIIVIRRYVRIYYWNLRYLSQELLASTFDLINTFKYF